MIFIAKKKKIENNFLNSLQKKKPKQYTDNKNLFILFLFTNLYS